MTIRKPRSVAQATALCERFAVLESEIGLIEAQRQVEIAEANAEADRFAQPLLDEREAIRAKLADWWPANAEQLTEGKRKSIELGGCTIGSVAGRESLAVEGDEKAVISALMAKSWAAPLLRRTVTLDRKAILMSLDGGHKRDLAKLGLSCTVAPETFVLKRAEQGGTLAGRTS